ncbi:MAG TPA: DUF202 domain-containing protein [Candidatus Dormibacteraeota bacterium]
MPERGRGGGEGVRVRDHLANVRTTLAWVRTGIVLIGVGYAVSEVAIVERLAGAGTDLAAYGRPLGLVAIAGGVAVAAASLLRFLDARARIESAHIEPRLAVDAALIAVTAASALVVLLSLVVDR